MNITGMNTGDALAMDNIVCHFGSVVALDHAALRVRRGTVHALLGENGAGKTTLMRIAFGMLAAQEGTVAVGGTIRHFHSPADAIRAGVGMVHQHYALVGAMTVAENVALGLHGRYDGGVAAHRVETFSQATGLPLDPQARVEALSVESQQRVEIVKALARGTRVLILDEPTAVLAPASADELLQWVRRFADEGGTVILITHKLREVLTVADDVTVLRRGQTVLVRSAKEVDEDALANAMVPGDASKHSESARSSSRATPGVARVSGDALVVADQIAMVDDRGVPRIHDASFTIARGEIVGVAAVEGEGQHELLRALAGRRTVTRGTLTLPPVVGFIPEDRQQQALVLDFPLFENVALRGARQRRGRMRWSAVRTHTASLMRAFDVRAPDPAVRAQTLSGGNQQKLVLARELDGSPGLLVADNPTRGLDIHATTAVYARLRAARDAGIAMVVYSSDLDELLALADRVLVVSQGRVQSVPLDRGRIGRAMLGLTPDR